MTLPLVETSPDSWSQQCERPLNIIPFAPRNDNNGAYTLWHCNVTRSFRDERRWRDFYAL